MKYSLLFVLFAVHICTAQDSGLYMTPNFKASYARQTRSRDGNPGPVYWQNRADYRIEVSLDPASGLLSGQEDIVYVNNSPDTLRYLLIHLFANVYKKGTPRDFIVRYEDESEGVSIDGIKINNLTIGTDSTSKSIDYIHNDFKLHLPAPLDPQGKLNLQIAWHYSVNKGSHMRTGKVDSTSYFIAYFFPRIAVYDDIDGWNDFFYSGRAEFYNDFGNFQVTVKVPENFVVWATGILQNPEAVFLPEYQQRLQKARQSDQIIPIIDESDDPHQITRQHAINNWKFEAADVSDFAFAISDHYLWQGSGPVVDPAGNRRVFISAAFNRHAGDFYEVARLAREAIHFMSTDFPGIPYPYPSMTVFNGLDEMEYPMMVNDMSFKDSSYVRKLTSHEIFHSYFPFYMGINESKYAWMDEGFASYGDYLISRALDKSGYCSIYYLDRYKENQIYDVDVPIMVNSKLLKKYAYHYNAYAKPAVFLIILRDLLGDTVFKHVIRIYMDRWQGKHPSPYDFFNTVNQITGKNLNWLFKAWFFEFGYGDLALRDVQRGPDGYVITIEKVGPFPLPLRLKIAYMDGNVQFLNKNVSIWEEGNKVYTLTVETNEIIKRIELVPDELPDADIRNNSIELDSRPRQ